MIRHTIFTMSIQRYSQMDATGNISLACRFRLPCKGAYLKLQTEVAKLFDSAFLENDVLKVIMYNRVTMYRSALLVLTFQPDNKKLREWYKRTFFREFTGDLDKLKAETERIEIRYQELNKEENKGNRSFEDIIAGIETLLGYSLDRSMSIYSFKSIYDLALKKANNG